MNQSTHTVYDLRGSVVRQYGATYPVWYEYDVHGRMTAMATTRDTSLDPATVDSLDHPSLDITRWIYDPATGLLTQKLYDDGKGLRYTYTPDGKLATRTWARGVVTEYGYDEAGELASIQYSDGTLPILKTYNRLGHPVSIISAGTTNIFEYSATTLEKISDTQLGYAIRYGNDNLGRMETLSITNLYDGSYAYDSFGRFATASFEALDFNYSYLPGSDQVATLAYGAVEKTVSNEALRNLVTGISYHNTNGLLIAERKYAYNEIGDVISRTRQRGGEPVETDVFDHNLRSELIAASLGGTNAVSGTYGYAYDPIGNRLVATNRGDVISYDANGLNQYTNIVAEAAFVPAFDDDGNQTLVKTSTGIWHVMYNGENRPVVWSNATAVIAMDYDYMGRRVCKRLLAGEGETVDRLFLYDGYLQIASIETNALVTTTFWDPTEPIATRPLAMKSGGDIHTYTHDLTKNVMEVLDSAGSPVVVYDYDAFGAMTASRPHLNRFGFSSEYYDADLGCVYYNYRHYNPLDGRWLIRDPKPEVVICFLYCSNSPLVLIDLLGKEEWRPSDTFYFPDPALLPPFPTAPNTPDVSPPDLSVPGENRPISPNYNMGCCRNLGDPKSASVPVGTTTTGGHTESCKCPGDHWWTGASWKTGQRRVTYTLTCVKKWWGLAQPDWKQSNIVKGECICPQKK